MSILVSYERSSEELTFLCTIECARTRTHAQGLNTLERVTTLSYFLSLDSLQVFLRRPLNELCASVSIQILTIHEIVCCGTAAQARTGTSLLVHLIRNHTLSHIILEFSLFVVDSCRFSFCSVLFCNLQNLSLERELDLPLQLSRVLCSADADALIPARVAFLHIKQPDTRCLGGVHTLSAQWKW